MDEQDLRRARNETFFRALNEEIVHLEGEQSRDRVLDLVCECTSSGCMKVVSVPLAEYEAVRASSPQFIVAPGHAQSDIEDVISDHDHYLVVEKRGAAAVVAERSDPRA